MPETRDLVAQVNQQFIDAFARGDAATCAAVYTEDGQVLPPQGSAVVGRTAIQAFWQGAMDMGVKAARLETVELHAQGATAYELGSYKLTADNGTVLDHGKYVVVWRREGADWRWHWDIWNSSMPPA